MKHRQFYGFYFCCTLLLTINGQHTTAQKMPVYDANKGFADYSKKMNAYYEAIKNRGNYYKQWKRLEWYYSTRLDEAGKIPDIQNLKQTALQKAAALRTDQMAKTEGTLGTSGNWVHAGPTGITSGDEGIGRVNRLAFHPSNANIFYAASAGGGLWKTTNGGSSWTPLTDGLPNLNISGVAVHKTDPGTLYILTGDGDGGGSDGGGDGECCNFGKYSTGVLKTENGGITWNYTGLKWKETDNILPFSLVMHPSNFSVLMAATSDGIWRTANGGVTWTEVLLNETVYDIEFMPNNAQVVYAAAEGGRFFRSMDAGLTWTNLYDNPNTCAVRVSIAVTPDHATSVYMLIANNKRDDCPADSAYTFNGLYYSSDNGDNWIKKASKLPNVFDNDGNTLVDGQQNYDHALVVSPFDEKLVITGGIRLFRSTNSGSTLTFINNNGAANYHVDVHELIYGPAGPTLYAATDGGVYKSTNNGLSWLPINGNLAITQYYRISVSTASSNYILGGAQDNGTHLRNNNSTLFDQVVGKDGMDNAISVSNPAIMYACAQRGDFRYSSNSGNSFSSLVNDSTMTSDYGINVTPGWVTPIDVSTTQSNVIFLGYYPLIKGIRDPAWDFYDIGTAGTPDVSGRTFVKVAPGNSNIIYAADNRYSFGTAYDNDILMWRTSNGGQSWKRVFPGGADEPLITDLAMNPDDPKEIWVTAGNFEEGRKVYRSLDSGQTWTNISGSLPNVPVNCILYDDNNGNPNDALYVGTDIGVFYRDNTLGDWVLFSTNLPVVEVTDLEINEAAGLLRAATYGRGVWQTSLYANVCITSHNFTANDHPPSQPDFYNASTTIISTAIITGAGAHIQYKAGDRITLNTGFRIDGSTGAKFIGYLGPCNSGGVPPSYWRTFNGMSGYLKE